VVGRGTCIGRERRSFNGIKIDCAVLKERFKLRKSQGVPLLARGKSTSRRNRSKTDLHKTWGGGEQRVRSAVKQEDYAPRRANKSRYSQGF